MKGKVLYIGGFELPDKNAAAQRVIGNAKAMRSLGKEVVLIGVTKSGIFRSFVYEDFTCYEIPYPSSFLKWVSFLFSIKNECEIIDNFKPDSLILYNYPAFKFYFLLNKYKNKGVKFYADVTEWYESIGFSLSSIIKRFDVWLRMVKLHPKTHGLIVISEYLENYYKNVNNNIINIPPLVDSNEEKWKSDGCKIENNGGINFVYAGSPGGGQKDRIDLIINSVINLAESEGIYIKLNIVGITKDEFFKNFIYNNLDNLIKLDKSVIFHGRVPHLKALSLIKNSDYSIFFRDNNRTNMAGFPTKFVEAITAGTPVITNYSSNLRFYFENYPTIGFGVNSTSINDIEGVLKTAVLRTRSEIDLLKSESKNLKLFDYNKFVGKFNALFSK